MDRAQSDLSLGFGRSHALPLPPPRIQIADDSITLHNDSSYRPSSNLMPLVPLQLLEQRFDDTGSHTRAIEEDNDVEDDGDDNDEQREEEQQFILLGHPMKLKRCIVEEPPLKRRVTNRSKKLILRFMSSWKRKNRDNLEALSS